MITATLLATLLRETARPPLPPGHPVSWGVLTAGTVLAGQAWPGWTTDQISLVEAA